MNESEIISSTPLSLKEYAFLFLTVHRWVLEFKRSRTSAEYEPRSGRPKNITTLEIIEKI